jgi:hypothetical protein
MFRAVGRFFFPMAVALHVTFVREYAMAYAVRGAEPRVEYLHRSPSGPIALTVSPFEFPQHPRRCWRIVGRWADRREFLLVLGISDLDALDRLDDALECYSAADLRNMRALWLERWSPGSRNEYPCWDPVQEVPLRTLRFQRTMRFKRRVKALDPFRDEPTVRRKGVA